jgi:glycosyltransferase involved in cell wall biosynthesis
MRILVIHNRYTQYGGEDAVFETETELLCRHNHFVERVIFDSQIVKSFFAKCLAMFRMFYNPEGARLLSRKIESFRPDIIHVHNFFPVASPSIFFVARRYGIPIVATLHNYRLVCPSAMLYHKHHVYEKSLRSVFPLSSICRGVYRNSVLQTAMIALMTTIHHWLGTWKNKVDRYVILTQFAKSKFNASALHIPEEKFVIKPNFVMDFGNGKLNREDFFLFVGRLSEEKGIEVLLKATHLQSFKLKIIGDGPFKEMVEQCAKNNPNIEYHGFQNKQVIIETMKKAKALIFPSIWYEGLPMTIIESFSTGTPVIASRLGGMQEVVTNDFNGLHFEAGNEKDLINKINTLAERTAELKDFSNNARRTYLEKYTPDKNYMQLTAIYEQAIRQKLATGQMVTDLV